MENMSRGFKEVDIANFSSQQKSERYPNLDEPAVLNSDEEWDEPPEDDNLPPRIARWRLNLVALSQRYNLYFAAFQEDIHVTAPRNLKQILPGKPDHILRLPRTTRARFVGGYIDPMRAHCVNNMIVGNLGSLEVLLLACDDGDVLAYYTHAINHALTSASDSGQDIPNLQPFFHENVYMTAWGLALHEKSRLIAVSTNLKQVTVFVLACRGGEENEHSDLPAETFTPSSDFLGPMPSEEEMARLAAEIAADEAEIYPMDIEPSIRKRLMDDYKRGSPLKLLKTKFLGRKFNYRKVLLLGEGGSNIPSIAFSDDKAGHAISVHAIDIHGTLWTLSIWDDRIERTPGIYKIDSNRQVNHGKMGWGVLILHPSTFRKVSTPQKALGAVELKKVFAVDSLGDRAEAIFDISSTISSVRDSSAFYNSIQNRNETSTADHFTSTGLIPDDSLPSEDIFPIFNPTLARMMAIDATPASPTIAQGSPFEEGHHNSHFPSKSQAKYTSHPLRRPVSKRSRDSFEYLRCLLDLSRSLPESLKSTNDLLVRLHEMFRYDSLRSEGKRRPEDEEAFLPDKSAILRLYQWDVELIPPTKSSPRTICRRVLKQRYDALPPTVGVLARFERLIMNIPIPELSLVVVGTQAGRVALLTVTYLDDKALSTSEPVVTLRLDRILPTKSQASLRPVVPLLGVAAAPLQDHLRNRGREQAGPRRWRVILHYYDHTILSYDLSRDENEALLVL